MVIIEKAPVVAEVGLYPALEEQAVMEIPQLLCMVEAVKTDHRITPASEWLLDNFYLIEEQIRTARRHLPKGYSRELPRLLGLGKAQKN